MCFLQFFLAFNQFTQLNRLNLERKFCCFEMLKNDLPFPVYVFVTLHYTAQRKIWISHPGSHPDKSHHPHPYKKCSAWTAPSGGKIQHRTAVCNQTKDLSREDIKIILLNFTYIYLVLTVKSHYFKLNEMDRKLHNEL